MEKRDEQAPSRKPQPKRDDMGKPHEERERTPNRDRDAEEGDEGLE
jgi:hypothetical protein